MNTLSSKISENRPSLIYASATLLFMFIGWLLYFYFGHSLIRSMYDGKSINILNRIIEGQVLHPVEHYLNFADRCFNIFNISILISLAILFFFSTMNSDYKKRKMIFRFIFVLLCAGLLVRVLCFSGYTGSDDGVYADIAYQIANGEFKIGRDCVAPIFPCRIGLFAPMALGFKIFGPNELVMISYPFILSMLSIIIAFIAGWIFFNVRSGLIAATIQTILPIDTRLASLLIPDLPAAFWAGTGVLLLYYGSNRQSIGSKTSYGIFSGFAFILAWLCKESTIYLAPFVGIYLAWCFCRDKRNVVLLLGASLIVISGLLIESSIYYRHTFDFFYRFHALERNYEVNKIWCFSEGSIYGWEHGNYWLAVAKRLFMEGPRAILMNLNLGLVNMIAILAIGYSAIKKQRTFLWPSLWFVSLAFMFNFGSSSLRSYMPLVLFDRFMYLLILPAIILTSGFLDALIDSKDLNKQRTYCGMFFWSHIIFLSIIFASFSVIAGYVSSGIQSPVERTVSHTLLPKDLLYTDSTTAWVLTFFWKYPRETQTHDFAGMNISDIPRGAYVLINRNRANFLTSTYGYILPKFYNNIPTHWILKWANYNAELYRIP